MDGFRNPSSTFTGSETAANLNSANAKSVTVKAKWKKDEPTIPTGACTGSYGRQVNVNLAVNGTQDFSYRGSVDCAYLQKAGYYKLEVWGASGSSASQSSCGSSPGYGGYSYGKIYSTGTSSLYVVVGSAGTYVTTNYQRAPGGYNGGGEGDGEASGGGGATHISVQNCGELKKCSSYKGAYDSSKGTYDGGKILIVAGGGGGMESCGAHAGDGGGYVGGTSTQTNLQWSGGGQNSGSAFGKGADAAPNEDSGGGGGGWYGGYASTANPGEGEGGGGSGYIGNSLLLSDKGMYQYSQTCTASTSITLKTTCTTATGAHVANAANTGDGYARITYLGM